MEQSPALEDMEVWKLRIMLLLKQQDRMRELREDYKSLTDEVVAYPEKKELLSDMIEVKNGMLETALALSGDLLKEKKNE